MKATLKRTVAMALVAAIGLFTIGGIAGASVVPQGKARGATTVELNTGTIDAVIGLGLTPAPLNPGVLGTHGDHLLASFPIVGNVLKDGVVKHTGGLSLSAGGTTLTLTNYWIETGSGVLTAYAEVNGQAVGRLPLFVLGGAEPRDGCFATASLALSSQAAGALTAVFGAPNLTGADFGVACVAPR